MSIGKWIVSWCVLFLPPAKLTCTNPSRSNQKTVSLSSCRFLLTVRVDRGKTQAVALLSLLSFLLAVDVESLW